MRETETREKWRHPRQKYIRIPCFFTFAVRRPPTLTMTASSLAATVGRPLPWLLAAVLLILSPATTTFFIDAFLFPSSSLDSRSAHQYLSPSPISTTSLSLSTLISPSLFHLAKIASITPTKSALKYAPRNNNESNRSGGPMSQVDSTKSGGCPFLDTSYVYKTYAVPALFSESGTCCLLFLFIMWRLCIDVMICPLFYFRLSSNSSLRWRMQPVQQFRANTPKVRYL